MECAGHRVDTTSQQFEFACEMQTKRKIDTIYFSPKFTTAFISIIFICRVSIVGGILLPQNIQKMELCRHQHIGATRANNRCPCVAIFCVFACAQIVQDRIAKKKNIKSKNKQKRISNAKRVVSAIGMQNKLFVQLDRSFVSFFGISVSLSLCTSLSGIPFVNELREQFQILSFHAVMYSTRRLSALCLDERTLMHREICGVCHTHHLMNWKRKRETSNAKKGGKSARRSDIKYLNRNRRRTRVGMCSVLLLT